MRHYRIQQTSVEPYEPQQAAASADVTSADAGATYTAAERALINELKSSLNDLKAKLRTAGVLAT